MANGLVFLIVLSTLIIAKRCDGAADPVGIEYFDSFGENVGLAYADGTIRFTCKGPSNMHLVLNNITVIMGAQTTYDGPKSYRYFTLPVKDALRGEYRCRDVDYNVTSEQLMTVTYRPCAVDEGPCGQSGSNCTNNTFCVFHGTRRRDEAGTCMLLRTECRNAPVSSNTFCPTASPFYYCQYMVENTPMPWVEYFGTDPCPSDENELFRLSYKNKTVRFNEQFVYEPNVNVTVHCPGYGSSDPWWEFKYEIKDEGGKIIDRSAAGTECANRAASFSLNTVARSEKAPRMLKLVVVTYKEDGETTTSSNTSRMTARVIFQGILDEPRADPSSSNLLTCNAPQNLPTNFRVDSQSFTYGRRGNEYQREGNQITTEPNTRYRCQVYMTWRSCFPVTKFRFTVSSKAVLGDGGDGGEAHFTPQPNIHPPISASTTNPGFSLFGVGDPWSYVIVASLVVASCVLVIGVLATLVVVTSRKRRKHQRHVRSTKSTISNKSSKGSVRSRKSGASSRSDRVSGETKTTRPSKPPVEPALPLKSHHRRSLLTAHRPLMMLRDSASSVTHVGLSKLMPELEKATTEEQQKKVLIEEFEARVVKCEASMKKRDAVVPIGSRYKNIPIRKDTQCVLRGCKTEEAARVLPMCQMSDFYGDRLLLSQAPESGYFVQHWTAIWQDKVGVIVWVGHLVDGGATRIDPYIPLVDGNKIRCGPFYVRTILAVKKPVDAYDTYSVGVTKTDTNETRELILVHVHGWPLRTVPLIARRQDQLANAVLHVEWQHKKQVANGLASLLAHCSDGVQASPSLLVAYIAYQMYQHSRCVDVMGVVEYVRRHQYCAWMMPVPQIFSQFHLVHAILYTLLERYENERAVQGKKQSLKSSKSAKALIRVGPPAGGSRNRLAIGDSSVLDDVTRIIT